MAVLNEDGVERSEMLTGVTDATDYLYPYSVGAPDFAQGRWRVPIIRWPRGPAVNSRPAIIQATFDSHGWKGIELLLNDVLPNLMWLFSSRTDDSTYLFFLEMWNRTPLLPSCFGGLFSTQIRYLHFSRGVVVADRIVYREPAERLTERYHIVRRVGANEEFGAVIGRVPRDQAMEERRSEILYVPFTGHLSQGNHLAKTSEAAIPRSVSLSERRLVLLWIEHEFVLSGLRASLSCRLLSADYSEFLLHSIKEVASGVGWDAASLAVSAVVIDGEEGVLAIWRNSDGHLMYCLRNALGNWEPPQETDIPGGRDNWLAATDRDIVLLAHGGTTLAWRRAKLECP